ncbi:MAG: ABC transporter permease [Alphaproteobacteria bacterium]|nr:ABC transporter permease [Alphaproteobacteria bacterium]
MPGLAAAVPAGSAAAGRRAGRRRGSAVPYLQSLPLWLVLGVFLLIPILTIVMVSFWDDEEYALVPTFILDNYRDALFSHVTWSTYLSTLRYAGIVWAATLMIGFAVAYYLAFHVRTMLWRMVLFQICTIPFLTSNVIRMISWIPFLGRNGLLNQSLMDLGITSHPLEFLLFSPFAVILAFVHLYTLFMVVPIFNTMMRIDRSLIEAARDAGAGPLGVLRHVVIPLSLPGISIGTIFVVTLTMGDFVTVQMMSGGQSASVGLMMKNQISLLQYPTAAAQAVVLLLTVLMIVWVILRVVDIRKEL